MPERILELTAEWDGIAVVSRYDKPTGTWIFICLHNDKLGPATGGTRMKVYASLNDALTDGMRLAEGMTFKWAGIGIGAGGGKAVLAIPEPLKGEARVGLLRRYGDLIETLKGTFRTGEDLGITTDDMCIVAERTHFVQGFQHGQKINPSPFTAQGVYSGIRAALGVVLGEDSPAGRTVLVQGVGNVGAGLAQLLANDGARVLVNDLDERRAAELAGELGGEIVTDVDLLSTECDVYAPCAIGATLNSQTIPELRCRIVAGSANNQLAEESDALLLLERGIVYAPDYIINAGGALSFALMEQGVSDRDQILSEMETIGRTVAEILSEALRTGETPVTAARRRVERTLGS